ncbi:MAG: T9SS type A sorting domain-containing protein [Bacteroidales bacterium]
MKKIALLAVLLMFVASTFGQFSYVQLPTKSKKQKTNQLSQVSQKEKESVWEINFDEAEPQYTLGHTLGTRNWQITDSTNLPQDMKDYMGNLQNYTTSSGNMAWIDGITYLLDETYENVNAYIQFDSIDLSEVDNPMLSFTQNYKTFNDDRCYIDYSLDGGATWEDSIEINTEPAVNNYAADDFFIILTDYVANESNVSFRIRWYAPDNTASGPEYSGGYGWQIDDIKIVDIFDVDMKLQGLYVNFFEYVDYSASGQDDYFHFSSHYGMVPDYQFNSDYAIMVFNAAVENFGSLDNAPELQVQVFDPSENLIYDESVTGNTLSLSESDTIDLLSPEFLLPEPEIGKYTVVFNINIEGDENPNNNTDTTCFFVTESTYGRDLDSITSFTGPSVWDTGGEDGDMLGTEYRFFDDSESIESMSVYIAPNSDPGTSLKGHLMAYDSNQGDWYDIMTTSIIDITENDIGGWFEIEFPEALPVQLDNEAFFVKAAVEFFYNGDNELMIGYDETVPASKWGTSWYFTSGINEDQWIYIVDWENGLGIRLNTVETINNEANIIHYSFPEQTGPADIDNNNHTIDITVENGTDLTSLVANFVLSAGATAEVGGVEQVSGITENDFSDTVIYKVIAEDSVTMKNWTVSVTVEECQAVSDLTIDSCTNSEVTISWIENGTATVWAIIYGETGFDPETEGIALMAEDIPFTIDYLSPGTMYDVYVKAHCGWAISDITGPVTFTTEGQITNFPHDENFDSGMPPGGWTLENGENWQLSYTDQAGGMPPEAFFCHSPGTKANQKLISPVINTSGYSSLILEFKYFLDDLNSGYTIGVATSDDGETWSDVWTNQASGDIGPKTETITIDIDNSDSKSENFQFCFYFDGDSNNLMGWYIDDVEFGCGLNNNMFTNSKTFVFPNPANNTVYVANAENADISIINMLGQVVASQTANSSRETVNISDLSNGTYIIRIKDGNEVITQKLNVIR